MHINTSKHQVDCKTCSYIGGDINQQISKVYILGILNRTTLGRTSKCEPMWLKLTTPQGNTCLFCIPQCPMIGTKITPALPNWGSSLTLNEASLGVPNTSFRDCLDMCLLLLGIFCRVSGPISKMDTLPLINRTGTSIAMAPPTGSGGFRAAVSMGGARTREDHLQTKRPSHVPNDRNDMN